MINIDQIISRCSAVDTGRVLLQEPSGAALTPLEFADRVQRLAGGFLDLAGDHKAVVGLLALNSVAYAETMCAAICAGYICVPLNLRWSLAELNYAIEDAEIEILVVDQVFYATALELAGSNHLIKHVYVTDSDCIDGPGKPLASLIGEPIILTLGRDPDTQCLISYTGGTTGFPKGVVHTHASLTSSAINMAIAGIPSKGSRYLIGVLGLRRMRRLNQCGFSGCPQLRSQPAQCRLRILPQECSVSIKASAPFMTFFPSSSCARSIDLFHWRRHIFAIKGNLFGPIHAQDHPERTIRGR